MPDQRQQSEECQEILADLERYLDGECAPDLEHFVTEHLVACPPCMNRADFERHVRDLVARCCKQRAPEDVMDRLRARLAEL